MADADNIHSPLTNSQVRERRRYLVARLANKAPADGWTHPRPSGLRKRVSNMRASGATGHFAVTSNTPKTWVTYSEAWDACAELGPGHLPAYVHSSKPSEGDHANRGLAFLDFDVHPGEYDGDVAELVAWRDGLLGELAELVGALPVQASVSGEGRHALFVMEGDWGAFFASGKKAEVESPYGGGAAKIELWSPAGNGRYRVETGKWEAGGGDTPIPRLSYDEFMALPSVASWAAERAEAAEREERQSKYPPSIEYARSYRGGAYRLARVGYDDGRPLLVAGDSLYVQRATNHVYERVGASGEELLELQDWASERFPEDMEAEGYGVKVVDALRRHLEHNASVRYAREAVPIIRSARQRGRPASVAAMVLESSVGAMNKVDYRYEDGGGPVFVFNDCVWDVGLGRALDRGEVRRWRITTSAPRIDLEYGAIAGAASLRNAGADAVNAMVDAWGPAWNVLCWFMLGVQKRYLVVSGLTSGAGANRGKTTLFNALRGLGLVGKGNAKPPLVSGSSSGSSFETTHQLLTEHRLVWFEEAAERIWNGSQLRALANIKLPLNVERKHENEYQAPMIGNLCLVSNEPPAIDTSNTAVGDRLVGVQPPAHVPQLAREYSGNDKLHAGAVDTDDGMLALADRLLLGFARVAPQYGPPLSGSLRQESDAIREACGEAYAAAKGG